MASTNVNTFFSYQAVAIQGNVFIAPGSLFDIGGAIDSEFFVTGTFTGGNNLIFQGLRVNGQNNNDRVAQFPRRIRFIPHDRGDGPAQRRLIRLGTCRSSRPT